MKILAISLLRLGDVLMAAPALQGLRQMYPNAHLDLLVNSSSLTLKTMLPYVSEFIEFDREGLQHGLVEPDRPIFEPYDKFKKFITDLNSHEYDLVVNLTQNKLSGYISSMINAKEHIGLSINSKGQATFGSPWFKYLNDIVASGADTIFHYSDIFYQGLELPKGQQKYYFAESKSGQEEVEDFIRVAGFKSAPKIVIQMFTSDSKKNWPIENWINMLLHLQVLEPNAQIILLCAPNEKSAAQKVVAKLSEANIHSHVACLSLAGALSLLHISDLLITGDTSIKHLAASTSIAVLELSLGSSDFRKTGAYSSRALILKSKVPCAPCSHFEICRQPSHLCAESFNSEMVAVGASKFLHNNWSAIKLLAEEYSDKVEFFRTEKSTMGYWFAEDILLDQNKTRIANQLDRLSWQFFLQREHLKPLGAYGLQGLLLKEQLVSNETMRSQKTIQISLDQIEQSTIDIENKLSKVLVEISYRMKNFGPFGEIDFIDNTLKQEIVAIESELGLGTFFTEKVNISRATGLYRVRQLQLSIEEIIDYQKIKLKLLRSLKNQIEDLQ